MKTVDDILGRLEDLIRRDAYEPLETEAVELKPTPSHGGEWRERHITANAFLNTHGGIMILGIKEEQRGPSKRYVLAGYREDAEPKIKDMANRFSDRLGHPLALGEYFPETQIRSFMDGRVAIIYVDALPVDEKYCFYETHAYRRQLTGDHKLTEAEIASQEELKEEVRQARELMPVEGVGPVSLDVDRLNEYIHLLNRQVKVETIKADIPSAMSFLTRQKFVVGNQVTTLGLLVCGQHPEDFLQFRCRVHGFVGAPGLVARDKQVMSGNILPLIEQAFAFAIRNIQVGVSAEGGGSPRPEYPEALLRETINNGLAHRDYSIDEPVTISIQPKYHVEIRSPGSFRKPLLIEEPNDAIPLRRIIPESKPKNPRLAKVLMVYNKWEGHGIGMSTMVNLCLQNQIDLPYYRLHSNAVSLFLCAGQLLDERMERLLESFDRHIDEKLQGRTLTEQQKLVLSYVMKAEWVTEKLGYAILLTPDNNHFNEITALERAGLIFKHSLSSSLYPVYMADRTLMAKDYLAELRGIFGSAFDSLDNLSKDVLSVVYRFNQFSKTPYPSARHATLSIWYRDHAETGDVKTFDAFLRKTRNLFNKLEKAGFILRHDGRPRYRINADFKKVHLL
jgi:ATP-dependent DNA helicase RecG